MKTGRVKSYILDYYKREIVLGACAAVASVGCYMIYRGRRQDDIVRRILEFDGLTEPLMLMSGSSGKAWTIIPPAGTTVENVIEVAKEVATDENISGLESTGMILFHKK